MTELKFVGMEYRPHTKDGIMCEHYVFTDKNSNELFVDAELVRVNRFLGCIRNIKHVAEFCLQENGIL